MSLHEEIAVNESKIFPAPILDLSPPPETKWDRERQAFLRLLPQLLQTHVGKYVAIHQEQVVDSAEDLLILAPRVYAKHGYVPIYMDLVAERPPVSRMPSVRNWTGRRVR
jgi:hypothetical protein